MSGSAVSQSRSAMLNTYFAGFSFTTPPASAPFGNLGRNAFRTPNFWQWDNGIDKSFRVTETVKVQFRSEFFDILNHTNFGIPDTKTSDAEQWADHEFGGWADRGKHDVHVCRFESLEPGIERIVERATTYSYTYYNPATQTGANTQTATVNGRWQTTTVDGFGRTIQAQKGNGTTVVSTVQTHYAPCGCSPLGKVSAVSQPYAPGGTVYWTTYTYDGSGRTLTVTAPDGASTTHYTYQGNSTTVTDPAGKWKTSTVDA